MEADRDLPAPRRYPARPRRQGRAVIPELEGLEPLTLPTKSGSLQWAGLINLLIVYVGWSGTYVAIRFAVREGSGFPPFSLIALRLLAAGAVLMLWAAGSRNRLRPTRVELAMLIASGILLWGGGNGLVVWAEQRAGAGYAALLIGATPIWAAVVEALVDRRMPSGILILSLLCGFAGVGVLAAPVLLAGSRADLLAILALVGAALSWSIGSVLQARRRVQMTPIATASLQHVVGGLLFVMVALAAREPIPSPTPEAWWAWGYLVVFGSIVTFTAFLRSLQLLPTSVVMTYSYVNPIGSVILGWLLLGESITGWTIAGAALVLLGVTGVFRSRHA